jgi:hypothetical protein
MFDVFFLQNRRATTNDRGAPIFFDQELFTLEGSLAAAERLDRLTSIG